MAKAALFSGLRGLARDLYKFPGCRSRAHDAPVDGPEDVSERDMSPEMNSGHRSLLGFATPSLPFTQHNLG